MPRTPAKFSLVDLNRAAMAAKKVGYKVRLTTEAEIILEPAGDKAASEDTPVDEKAEVRL